jgi:hypothetical protein
MIFSIAADTLNAAVDTPKLTTEITASAIVPALDAINTDSDVLEILFTGVLSAPEETILIALVGAHDGIPVPVIKAPTDVNIMDKDSDTAGIKVTTKYAPDGFYQRLHEIEFTTATVDGAIHDKNAANQDTGFSTCDFYEDVNGVETLMVSPTQLDLDTKCIRTDYKFMPNVDFMIMSGVVTHQEVPTTEVYMWGFMLDVDPALNAYNIFPITVLDGGMAMSFVSPRDPVGLKGVNGTMLYHAGVMPPTGVFVNLPPGLGTNRIRFMMRHQPGYQHRFQAIFEIFKA